MKCRICGSRGLTEYLDLGKQPLADNFPASREQFETEKVFPLTLLYCNSCSLSQLGFVVPKEELYTDDYPYETGINLEGVEHFARMTRSLSERFRPNYVVDIGSNDGTLLRWFDCKVCGIEPVSTIAEKACVYTINGFFDSYTVDQALTHGGKADVITATNVFAHVDNLHGFMWCVDRLLSEKGVFVIEAPYLPDMIKNLAFDTVYHEHLSYLSIKPLCNLFRQYNMEIFDVKHSDVHCGTMRYYVARRGEYPITSATDAYFVYEQEFHDINVLSDFGFRSWVFAQNFAGHVHQLKKEGIKIAGISAPAKGNTLLNFCGFNPDIIDYITERSERKIGKFTPGSHIPVVGDDMLVSDPPDIAIIFAHNWAKQITNNIRNIGYNGGVLIPNGKGLEDLCVGAFRACGECGCQGAEKKGLHECCGVQG